MKNQILTQFPWPWLTVLALLIFFGFFIALLIRVSSKSRIDKFQTLSRLPLQDGEKHE